MRVAQQLDDAAVLVGGHVALGVTLFWQGKIETALTQFRRGLDMFDPNMGSGLAGSPPGVSCQVYLALMSWTLGYPGSVPRS